jgi:hypothetical protein
VAPGIGPEFKPQYYKKKKKKFKASLDYISRPCFKKKNKKTPPS